MRIALHSPGNGRGCTKIISLFIKLRYACQKSDNTNMLLISVRFITLRFYRKQVFTSLNQIKLNGDAVAHTFKISARKEIFVKFVNIMKYK